MSKLFLPILLAVGFFMWKALDYLQLPNTFSILLILFTIISGILWSYHRFAVLPRRVRKIAQAKQKGQNLSEAEKAKIEPISEGAEFISSLFPVLSFVLILRSFLFEPFQIPSQSMEPTLRVGDFILVEKFAYGIKDPIWQNTLIETGKVQRGDVVVFKAPPAPNIDYIKRVIGISGDRVIYNELERTITLVYGKNGQHCHDNCNIKQFSYDQPSTNDEFKAVIGKDRQGSLIYGPSMLELTEYGDVSHKIHWYPEPISESYRYKDYTKKQQYVTEWLVPEGHYFMMGDNRNMSEDSRFWGFVPERNIVGKARYIWLSLDKKPDEFPTGLRFSRFFTSIK